MIIDIWLDRLKWWKRSTVFYVLWVTVTLVHCLSYVLDGKYFAVALDVLILVMGIVSIVCNIKRMRYIREYIKGLEREYFGSD